MDPINERKVFGQLVSASCQEGTPQVGAGARGGQRRRRPRPQTFCARLAARPPHGRDTP
jgi:hypothetical protein